MVIKFALLFIILFMAVCATYVGLYSYYENKYIKQTRELDKIKVDV